MTRKLTDEQVKEVRKLNFYPFIHNMGELLTLEIRYRRASTAKSRNNFIVCVCSGNEVLAQKAINTISQENADKAIAYAEHLLNQRYQWLPQNNGWIMSGVSYTLKDAGKVMELMSLTEKEDFIGFYWYHYKGSFFDDFPHPIFYKHGITIDKDSPIWDAVKGD
jgi:hypothetical protein